MIFRKTLSTISRLHLNPKFSIYNVVRYKDYNEQGINLYESTTLKNLKSDDESNYKQIFENSEVSSKYVQLIPFFLEKLILKHKKHFVIKMELLPKSESLKMTCLSNSGVHTKYVELESLIPVIEADYREITANKLSYPPPFIDNDMIYFNTCLNEFYVFDRDSVWNEEGVQNPLLDLSKRFNEKKWLDYLRTD